MAVPKRRKTGSKMRMRRAHWRVSAPTYSSCPQCREPKLPHRVCTNCGHYAGRQAVETE
ncbi:50S ribosomal protein L32 [soil metagenome]|jgi:large subunit ribosomal protein L32|nr:50S ribosomal protein L32 [Actinomycetota bacterium]MDQ3531023.1 50S ribosomal protein L32 [Actinomycetota bacterium]